MDGIEYMYIAQHERARFEDNLAQDDDHVIRWKRGSAGACVLSERNLEISCLSTENRADFRGRARGWLLGGENHPNDHPEN